MSKWSCEWWKFRRTRPRRTACWHMDSIQYQELTFLEALLWSDADTIAILTPRQIIGIVDPNNRVASSVNESQRIRTSWCCLSVDIVDFAVSWTIDWCSTSTSRFDRSAKPTRHNWRSPNCRRRTAYSTDQSMLISNREWLTAFRQSLMRLKVLPFWRLFINIRLCRVASRSWKEAKVGLTSSESRPAAIKVVCASIIVYVDFKGCWL